MKDTLRTLLLCVCTLVLGFSLWRLWSIYDAYEQGKQHYEKLEQYVTCVQAVEPVQTVPAEPPKAAREEQTALPEPQPDLSAWLKVDFAQLEQINPDIVGWILIEGTNINYPVVQGADNEKYLSRLFDGSSNKAGCIFLDSSTSADFSDRNSVIYGHHMKDHSMFAGLVGYKEQEFYEAHQTALLVTPDAYYRIEFFSGYVSNAASDAWDTEFDEYGWRSWLMDVTGRSCFTAKSAPQAEDRVITLSTCTYEYDDARFVVHGYIAEEYANPAFQ